MELGNQFQSLFYWIINSIYRPYEWSRRFKRSFNPYSTGLSILSILKRKEAERKGDVSILILLDYQFYLPWENIRRLGGCLVSILILLDYQFYLPWENIRRLGGCLVSILILLDYQFYHWIESIHYWKNDSSFNPYSTGLSILSVYKEKNMKKLNLFQSLFYWIINSILEVMRKAYGL